MTEVALGNVGLIISLETSRLTRSNADWQKLLTICEVRDTLLADAEGVYSLRIHNDRMLLGLKGTVSEIELHTLRERMILGARNKAERGEMIASVPVGYLLTEEGAVEKSPDAAIRNALDRVFQKFREVGSIFGTALALDAEGFRFPHRTDPFGRRPVRWQGVSNQSVSMLMRNPFYAGAYVWGRVHTVATVSEDGTVEKHRTRRGDPAKWPILRQGHHPGYITWDEFEETRHRLRSNRRGFGHPGPVGRGSSILAGLVRCGFCDASMVLSYGGRDHRYSHFHCPRREASFERNPCQSFAGRSLEEHVEGLLLSVLEPQSMEAILIAEADLESGRKRLVRQWDLEVERLAQAEARARRKHDEVEPGNRMVARALEEAWEAALSTLEEARRTRERRVAHLPPPLTPDERSELRHAIGRVDHLWRSESTTPQQRKELTRLLIHQVTSKVNRSLHRLEFEVRWVRGHQSRGHLPLLRQKAREEKIRDDDLTIIRRMAPTYEDAEIAIVLGRAARRTPEGNIWTARRVGRVRKEHAWERDRTDGRNLLSMAAAARILHADRTTLEKSIRRGEVRGSRPYPGAHWRIHREDIERLASAAKRIKKR